MLEVIVADITTLDVEVIVNAANNSLLGGGGVDAAIHKACGPELLEFCKSLGGCKTGHAKISPAFQMSAKAIIHTVGPVWSGGHKNESILLKSCYQACIQLAVDHHLQSIAFPAISTGVYSYPKKEAAQIALSVLQPEVDQFKKIIICCHTHSDYELYQSLRV